MARPSLGAAAGALFLLLVLVLGGCSLPYNLRPHIRAGHPAFGTGSRLCILAFEVTTSEPAHWDAPRHKQFPASRILWRFEVPFAEPRHCIRGPVVYGVVPQGAIETHAPARLYQGVAYSVSVEGGRRGIDRFRFTPRGKVERIPLNAPD